MSPLPRQLAMLDAMGPNRQGMCMASSRRSATAFHPPPLTVADLPGPLQNAFMATVGNGKPLGMAKAQKVLKIELDGASWPAAQREGRL